MSENVIKTGLNLMNTAYNGAGGIVISGEAVKGGYFVTPSIEITDKGEDGKIPSYACTEGTLCYCTKDNKFYQYRNGKWIDIELDGLAEKIRGLDYIYDAKEELKNKTYFVEMVSQEDGKISIVRKPLPNIEIASISSAAKTLENGKAFTVVVDIEEIEDEESIDNGHKILKTIQEITIPTIIIEDKDNLTIDTTTFGTIKLGHGTAEEGDNSVVNGISITPAKDAIQLKDTDSIKFSTTIYDANGHKNGSEQKEYKMPKLTSWGWENGTIDGPIARLSGEGITTLEIPKIPSASAENSGIVTTCEQTFSGNKTFANDVSITGNLNVSGTTTSVDFETAVAKENIIITNSDNTSLAGTASGIAIMTGKAKPDYSAVAYGIMYDPTDDLIKLGQGSITNTGGDYEFAFEEGEKEVIATREYVDAADAKLQDSLNNFENSIGFVKTGDETFSEKIDRIFATKEELLKEIDEREQSDSTIYSEIDSIYKPAVGTPDSEDYITESGILIDKILAETNRAKEAESSIDKSLSKEIQRATEEEKTIRTDLTEYIDSLFFETEWIIDANY